MRRSAEQRLQHENRIRAVMDQLLNGEVPPNGRCDIKTLAREAGVDRTAFYGTRPPTPTCAKSSRPDSRPATRPATTPTGATPRSTDSKTRSPPSNHDSRDEIRRSPTSPPSRPKHWPGSPPNTRRSTASAGKPTKPHEYTACPSAPPQQDPAVDRPPRATPREL